MSTSISSFFLIQQINLLVVKRVDEALKAEKFTARQFLILDLLADHEPCSSAELARHAQMTPQSLGEFVKTLETRGLVERTDSLEDARSISLQRSKEGREAFNRCRKLVRQAEADFFGGIQASELANIRGYLALVREREIARNLNSE